MQHQEHTRLGARRRRDSRGGAETEARAARLERQIEREREGARQLRAALELAATYFHAPVGDESDDRAWQQIVTAIRSDAGRATAYLILDDSVDAEALAA